MGAVLEAIGDTHQGICLASAPERGRALRVQDRSLGLLQATNVSRNVYMTLGRAVNAGQAGHHHSQLPFYQRSAVSCRLFCAHHLLCLACLLSPSSWLESYLVVSPWVGRLRVKLRTLLFFVPNSKALAMQTSRRAVCSACPAACLSNARLFNSPTFTVALPKAPPLPKAP